MKGLNSHLRFAVLAADTALFTIKDGALYVRLITVDRPPHFKNVPGLPGGLLHPSETAEQAAVRHLKEKAGVEANKTYIEQLYTFSHVGRDPRGRVVAVAYLALVPWEKLSVREQGDSRGTRWVRVMAAKKLAYDHDEILALALLRLRSRVHYTTLINKLMPHEFTLTELEKAYECLISTDLDKRNFRKKILKLKILKKLPNKKSGGRFRPAQLYTFASPKVTEIEVL
ncbi:MAG: NUDIX domain-containing protein [bacterium]|nr:NUDIX domain-containing protein [bacterium]